MPSRGAVSNVVAAPTFPCLRAGTGFCFIVGSLNLITVNLALRVIHRRPEIQSAKLGSVAKYIQRVTCR